MRMEAKRQELFCPVETTLDLLSGRWKVKILWKLRRQEAMRFGELKELLGRIADKVLTAQLRELENDGLISRRIFAEFPPRVEYSLTDFGRSLEPVFETIGAWGNEQRDSIRRALE